MTLKDTWAEQEAYTKSASDSARQIAFAGIAVVWIFKSEHGGILHLEFAPLFAGACLVTALAMDLLQYLLGAITFQILGDLRERRTGKAQDDDNPTWIFWPLYVFFYGKHIFILSAFGALTLHFISKIG